MFDTVALSETKLVCPFSALPEGPSARVWSDAKSEPYRVVLNSKDNRRVPRLTVSRHGRRWITRVEASLGKLLYGSNLHLPTKRDITDFLDAVEGDLHRTAKICFDARRARVARLDVTRDFRIDPARVLQVIDRCRSYRFPKYNTILINGTTVRLDAKGKTLSKRYQLYSKYHECLHLGAPAPELNMAEGLLHLEIQHRTNRLVYDLANSLRLPDHSAAILTSAVSEAVLTRAEKLLNVAAALSRPANCFAHAFLRHDRATGGQKRPPDMTGFGGPNGIVWT